MLRHLSLPAVLIAAAILSAVGCQACSSCYDYSRPVADSQCGCCGCQRCGSAHCGCNSCDCNSGEAQGGQVMMDENDAPQGTMPQNGQMMSPSPAASH
jgi:hypothetical protein